MKLKIETKYCQVYDRVMDSDGNAKMAATKAYVKDYPFSEAKDPIYREVKTSSSRRGELSISEMVKK